jgi:diguanylate cyclase (GGDEF)-like protein/PAS domain S-box-containing protein
MTETGRILRLDHDVDMIATIYDAAPIGVAVWSDDGRLMHANPVFCQLVGRPAPELAGILFEHFVRVEDTDAIVGKIADLWAGRRNYIECDFRCLSPDGQALWLRTYLAPVYGSGAEPEYVISHIFNFGGRGARDAQLRIMANSSPVMLWLTDQSARPRLGNRTCFDFLGVHQPSGDLGHVWADAIHPTDLGAADARIGEAVAAHQPFEFVARSRRRDGTWRWLHHLASPILDASGEFQGYSGASVDVTDFEHVRAELRESQQLFESLSEAGPVAIARTDPEGRITDLNGRWADLLPDHERRLPEFGWRDIIRPEDVDRLLELGADSIAERRPFTVRVRAFDPHVSHGIDEGELWGELRAAPVFDADGEHTGFVATLIDISSEVRTQDRADQLARVLDASLDYVLIAQPTGAITYANDAVARTFGLRVAPTDAGGAFLWDLLARESVEQYYEAIEPLLQEDGVWRGELVLQHADGAAMPVSAQLLAHRDGDRFESVSIVARDISDVKVVHEQLRHLATHDKLTGLANRALLYDRLDQALARSHRLGAGVALMYCDLDHFKPVNDEFGHDAGDAVLTEIAERIKQVVRDTDTAARVGGDEFVVLVEGVRDLALVQTVAERLLVSVTQPIDIGTTSVEVSASIGLVLAPEGCDDADQLMSMADRAMYRAKAGGRRRIEVLRPTPG